MLSGTQQRNLEAAWHTPVIDRIALIIAIFSKRAKSREAKLQVVTADPVSQTDNGSASAQLFMGEVGSCTRAVS